jgi:hypothetical protein
MDARLEAAEIHRQVIAAKGRRNSSASFAGLIWRSLPLLPSSLPNSSVITQFAADSAAKVNLGGGPALLARGFASEEGLRPLFTAAQAWPLSNVRKAPPAMPATRVVGVAGLIRRVRTFKLPRPLLKLWEAPPAVPA